MYHRRPPRLVAFDYRGGHRYFVTCCTDRRRAIFISAALVGRLRDQILPTCHRCDFALLAYVFMPDHLHMLLDGRAADSDFRKVMRTVRQRTSVAFHEHTRTQLWQRGYFERVLRPDDDVRDTIIYILANPVRAGLVQSPQDYPFSWAIQEHDLDPDRR